MRIALTPGAIVISPQVIAQWIERGTFPDQPHHPGDPALLAVLLPVSL